MVSKNSLSFKKVGKILMPEKILGFEYTKKLNNSFERVSHNRLHTQIIVYLFSISFFISMILYFLFFDIMYYIFIGFMTSGMNQFATLSILFFIINLFVYWIILLFFFVHYDGKLAAYEEAIEKNLPDFLDNLVSNLKGGFVLEKALLKSVRDDQKELLEEMTLINEKIMAGASVISALEDMQSRFNSPVIGRTMFLIIEGLKGGGNMASPLQRISDNLKRIYMLNDEVKSNVGGFSVIIKMIGGFVSPALFALAITLLVFIGDLLVVLSKSQVSSLSVSELPIEYISYLTTFSYSMIVLVSVFSNLIIAQLNGDEFYRALKSMPVTIIISCALYYFMSQALIGYFSGII